MVRKISLFFILSFIVVLVSAQSNRYSTQELLIPVKKASSYIVNTISCNGGYVWKYSKDFSEQYRETPARESQIWIQSGTPKVEHLFF